MADASRKHHGKGVKGKGDGTGAMSEIDADLPENEVLSNRDKKQHSEERGLDSRHVQTEQRQDHPGNRQPELEKEQRERGDE
jgi:hypothetical protein